MPARLRDSWDATYISIPLDTSSETSSRLAIILPFAECNITLRGRKRTRNGRRHDQWAGVTSTAAASADPALNPLILGVILLRNHPMSDQPAHRPHVHRLDVRPRLGSCGSTLTKGSASWS